MNQLGFGWQKLLEVAGVSLECVIIVILLVALLEGAFISCHPDYVYAGGNVSVTRQFSPLANAAVTSNAGDNDGFETTPANAYANDDNYAVDTDSGADENSDPTGTGTDKHNYYNYGLSVIPAGSAINGITLRADIAVDSTSFSPFTAIRLSYDGGNNWTVVKQVTLTATAETTYTYGGSSDTWGRTWATSDLSDANFRVQVINGDAKAQNSLRDFSPDWIPVSITFTAPWESYKTSARTEVWGDGTTRYTSDNHVAYMKGTGFADVTYNVAYYDADGTWIVADENIGLDGGVLKSVCDLTTDENAVAGTWHALVQPASGYTPFPSTGSPTPYDQAVNNPDTYGLLANDSFEVAESAIPEFPTVMAGILVAGLCVGIYYWMRKRKLAYVKA